MITQKHSQEWLKSAVDKILIKLNVKSLEGYEPLDRLLYGLSNEDRRNDGRIRDKILNRYAHTEHGGWWVSGIDILTGFESLWGQFKPDCPYQYQEEYRGFDPQSKAKNKIIKYEPPKNVPTEIFALSVPLHLWKAIALRYDIPLPENIVVTEDGKANGFWAWVIEHPSVPLIITEGAKKAGALLTAGYVAVALPGIYNGYRQKKDDYGNKIGLPTLIPQLKAFAQKEREIIFCFDNDVKPKTVKNVRMAIASTGRLFAKQGCRVSAITWIYPEKGVDDLIAALGVDCFNELYKARLPLSRFNLISLLDLSKYNPLQINERYLSENLVTPEFAQIIGLRSPKGTGKTEWLVRRIQKFIREGKPVLVITHRIQLAKALCARFGIDHIEEVKNSETKGILGYGLCIDSLHSNSSAHFNPDHWSEAVVVLDECEQVIWHTLESSTCRDNRVAIIENFQRLLQIVISTGGKIYLSDADLSCIAIDYVQQLIGVPVDIWIVDNVYKSRRKRQLYTYSGSDPRDLVSALVKDLKRGEKALIHTTGQKTQSKWGSINLESYLKKLFPGLKILRIDSESVSEPGHQAMGCMENLNAILPLYDIVICSPVVETGVSIDLTGHFNSVWCIAYGLQTVDAVCQALERLRDDVPRHIWIKTTAKGNRIGNGSTSFQALLRSQNQQTKSNILLLQQAGFDEFDDLDANFCPSSLFAWAKRACLVNVGKNNYRQEIINKLLSEGYELVQSEAIDIDDSQTVKNQIKETAQQNYQQFCQAVPQVDTPSDSELETLANKKAKTPQERLIERKGKLIKRYGLEVTPELVEKDDHGWYGQLQLHYYLTVGNIYLAGRDRRSLAYIKEQGLGKGFQVDINKQQLSTKIKALQYIGIEQFFDESAEFSQDSLADWLDFVIKLRFDIHAVLGVCINPEKDTAVAVAQRILAKFGLSLKFKHQVRRDGKRVRIYSGCNLNNDGRSLVFDNWHLRDKNCKSEFQAT
ncbi:MAG: plasmid replication protein, CyRepA1 family [Waterburya sp.]